MVGSKEKVSLTFGESINQALAEIMSENYEVVLLGEDICDPYGGAFKITRGLSVKYPQRVINTPMSEQALTGVAAGMAMRGLRPVLEIMFGDFLTLCADQIINHIAKFNWMYNGRVKIPLVIRTPMGGRRGYGPTHSQTLEKIFLGIPGIKIIAPSNFHDPGKLLIKAIVDDDPVLFLENKFLYAQNLCREDEGYILNFAIKKSEDIFETLVLSNTNFEDDHITILTYGGMLPFVVETANELLLEEEVGSRIIIPSHINKNLATEAIESVKITRRAVVVEEGTFFAGWGAEMSARITCEAFKYLNAPIKRVASLDSPIGCAKDLEDSILPQKHNIKTAIKELLGYDA
jgi:pyruvate/2-oxoglutarate/acetoin dehydrogenase E1 component